MLITEENILRRFSENLEWATGIDLATAWAGEHKGLGMLKEHATRLRIRAVVGLWGNLTDPSALRRLNRMGKVRLVGEGRLFHPKVYMFRGECKSVAWIGSANFTFGGFGANEEVMFETSDTEAMREWFDLLWERCGPLGECAIDDYAKAWNKNPPRPMSRPPTADNAKPLQLLKNVHDWKSYVAALKQCDRWWSERYPWSVLGEPGSWMETIRVLNNIIVRDLDQLDVHDQNRLLGLTGKASWALLGPTRWVARKVVFGDKLGDIQDIVRRVARAGDDELSDLATEAYEKITKTPRIGKGTATRLLALARPDRFVSVNDQSIENLATHFGVAWRKSSSKKSGKDKHKELLKKIYNQAWFREPEPEDAYEKTIWGMRVALLDCFVYDPDSGL